MGMTGAVASRQQSSVREFAAWDSRVRVQEAKAPGGTTAKVFTDVTVLGLKSENFGSNGKPRTYTKEAVQAAIPLYEGARVFMDHTPAWELPSINRLAGELSGVYWDEPSQMLRAKELRIEVTDRTAHALHLCEQKPHLVGLSHDVTLACPTDDDSQVVAIVYVRCVDLVPGGATTGGLYEQAGWNPDKIAAAMKAAAAGAPINGAPTGDTTMNEQETKQLQALEQRANKAEAEAAEAKQQLAAVSAKNIVATALEQAADLPEATRKNLRTVMEATSGLTAERAQEMVKGRREELSVLGLLKPAETAAAPVVTGAGAGEATKPVQEQATKEQVDGAAKMLREQAGRAAGLKGETLKHYVEQGR